ncbi:MAG: cytochrome c biogenesis heme-transporting ATPase CcmA [Rickettsiella sp.]|nr:cytochrome c biogenesis heme-transporting ATPase CcmA [Rickettsiella sp.]
MTLTVNGLSYERNKTLLFHGLAFQIYSGEALHIIGPNGAGKTSLLQILTGLLLPLAGNILWNDVSIYNSSLFKKKLIYVSHKLGMKGILTPYENLYLFLVRRGLGIDSNQSFMQLKHIAKKKIDRVLEKLDLSAYKTSLTNSLSAGQQRRLALAKLLLVEANCWILDEPFTSLDSKGTNFFSLLIEQHLQSGGVVIFTSHQSLSLSEKVLKRLCLGERSA